MLLPEPATFAAVSGRVHRHGLPPAAAPLVVLGDLAALWPPSARIHGSGSRPKLSQALRTVRRV